MKSVRYGNVWPKGGKRLMRSIYSKNQVEALEELFQSAKYHHKTDMEQAALRIGLSYRHVKIWFQNRRSKEKKQTGKEFSPKANNQNLSELFQRLESANELLRMESEPSIEDASIDVNNFITQFPIPKYNNDEDNKPEIVKTEPEILWLSH